MKRTLEILLLALLAAGLATGCPKKDGEGKDEEPKEEEPKEEEPKEEEPAADAGSAEAAEVDEGMYIKAAFEVTCVKSKIEDSEKQKEILAEVYPRYGFEDATAYETAETAMQDKESVKIAVQERMEKCTPELAAKLKEGPADLEGEGETEKDDGDKKKVKKAAWKPGTFKANSVTGGGLSGASMQVRVRSDGTILGQLKGEREGKAFNIPFKGKMQSDGDFTATGRKGPSNLRIQGRYAKGQLAGKVNGAIYKKGLKVNFTAK